MSNESLLKENNNEITQPRSKLMITGLVVLTLVSGIFALSLLLASHGLATPVIAFIGHGMINALGAAISTDMLIGIFTTISAISLFASLAEIVRPGSVKRLFTKMADNLKALSHKVNSLLSTKWNPFLADEGKFSWWHYFSSLKNKTLLTLGKTFFYPFAYLAGLFYLGGEALAKRSKKFSKHVLRKARIFKGEFARRLRKRSYNREIVFATKDEPQAGQEEATPNSKTITPASSLIQSETIPNSEAANIKAAFAKLVAEEEDGALIQFLKRKSDVTKRDSNNKMRSTRYMKLESIFNSLNRQQAQAQENKISDEEIIARLTGEAKQLLEENKNVKRSDEKGYSRFGDALVVLGMFQRLQAGQVENNNQFLYIHKPQSSAN